MENKTQKTMTNYCIDGIIDSLDHCATLACEGCRGQQNPNCVKELSEMARDAIQQLREEKAELTGKNLELEMMVQDLEAQYKGEIARRVIHDSIRDNAMRNAIRVKVRKR